MKVLLVANNRSRTTGPLDRIFRIADYPVFPQKDSSIEYQEDWSLSDIKYIYISLGNSLPEIGLSSSFDEKEIDKLIDLGWSRTFQK